MESKKGIWLRTKDDGVLLFKNVNLSMPEADKEDKKDGDSIEHSKETVIHKFQEEETPFPQGSKYFHTEMQVFCTVADRTEDDGGKLTSIKINMPALGIENTQMDIDDKIVDTLKSSMDIYLRAVMKSGSKFTIHGSFDLNKGFKENMTSVFEAVGQNMGKFKLFHNEKILNFTSDFADIFEPGKDTYIYAFESLGKPRKWTRFPR